MNILSKVSKLTKNILLDIKYGGILSGDIKTRHGKEGAMDVSNTAYSIMPLLFKDTISKEDILVDVGCGKGRIINWWLDNSYGVNGIYGIELDSEVANKTQTRLNKYENVTILNINILDYLEGNIDANVFFLFNPFDNNVMTAFLNKIKEIVNKRNKPIRILYYNCAQLEVFAQDKSCHIKSFEEKQSIDLHDFSVIEVYPHKL